MKSYICVIGGANIDISATPNYQPILHDSTPGKTRFSLGGVARNIAENLALLGEKIELITAIGDDFNSEKIKANCLKNKINLEHSLFLPNTSTSTYICINDESGEMKLAVADMGIYKSMDIDFFKSKIDLINQGKALILDTNIEESSIEYLLNNCTVPVFVDTVSIKKAKKIKNYLNKIFALKPNLIEAEYLTGVKIKSNEDIKKAAEILIESGIKQAFISLGSKGVYYKSLEGSGFLPCYDVPIVNTTGAGDSFMATIVYSFIKNFSIEKAAKLALASSALCVGSKNTVYENLSYKNLKNLSLL